VGVKVPSPGFHKETGQRIRNLCSRRRSVIQKIWREYDVEETRAKRKAALRFGRKGATLGPFEPLERKLPYTGSSLLVHFGLHYQRLLVPLAPIPLGSLRKGC
jgi:hypothetical protein